jgi:hypothetical protein
MFYIVGGVGGNGEAQVPKYHRNQPNRKSTLWFWILSISDEELGIVLALTLVLDIVLALAQP